MISFVTWKWRPKNSPRPLFSSEHVNVLHAMVRRWYDKPFRFICVTDDPRGLDARIETIPMPVRFDDIHSPEGARFPQCYCRLWNFSRETSSVLGERIMQLDIDLVITGDLTPIVERDEDFVGWSDPRFQANKIAGGAYLLRTGTLPHVWEDFDPVKSPAEAHAAGFFGSDQGWMSYKINNGQATVGQWNGVDGLVKLRWTTEQSRKPPANARIVFTTGMTPPWLAETQRKYPWIKEAWRK